MLKADLKVMDLGSLYGTKINGSREKIEPNTWMDLTNGSLIHFGAKNTWMVKWQDIFVLCSTLSKQDKISLDENLLKLGGQLISAWHENVAYMVVGELKFTAKVTNAFFSY